MPKFEGMDRFLSLCGLNCGLCPMYLGQHCGGCGQGSHSCSIVRCSKERGGVEYCFACDMYPCDHYLHIDDFDSFITHQRQKADLSKAKRMGIERYNEEQAEKMGILQDMLRSYNDGRHKTFFCVTINLLELSELREILGRIQSDRDLPSLSHKEQCAYVVSVFQEIADRRALSLKLRRKK